MVLTEIVWTYLTTMLAIRITDNRSKRTLLVFRDGDIQPWAILQFGRSSRWQDSASQPL